MTRFLETEKRSIVKSLTFRVIVVAADFLIIFVITKHIGTTVAVTIITNVMSTILYYFHERVWNNVHWGKHRAK